mmetsp:Transcript_4286/g.9050  ORF Transcript_4286/g.9050 Transcript_4286/m.9050 type:complete len:145 (-) Transcript_4286:354-788(-)|eukprot:CAMPEP_0183307980 /NCGR_PEP_ID=MMETSP0160_2-20130417/19674_1 /TAXON_ID=2839 ORGANISM="Odontella Sinensis, Strain Grunow 1884" /NCGR_SAMPLE_ID=MMETSP0160_2 /ASSEMBLY_ACC=CAM_ASM_000250 /LENGTH=144 /DNA_ID=CAMNT_0025471713 /DNA_START=86 /DNA_END=520 /DNA_ORIENTATION=-
MSNPGRRNEQQHMYLRQATILRKNLYEWDRMLRSARGEDWPSMLGRLNAALNQAGNLDAGVEDVMEHFVYLPRKCPVNAQDVPFFLSTRLADAMQNDSSGASDSIERTDVSPGLAGDPVKVLRDYENRAIDLAGNFEEKMVRFD